MIEALGKQAEEARQRIRAEEQPAKVEEEPEDLHGLQNTAE